MSDRHGEEALITVHANQSCLEVYGGVVIGAVCAGENPTALTAAVYGWIVWGRLGGACYSDNGCSVGIRIGKGMYSLSVNGVVCG